MSTYLVRRILQMLPILLFISVVSFAVMRLAPGDPAQMYANPQKRVMTVEEMELIRERLGLNKPIHIQYFIWLKNTLQGNWGYSYKSKAPVLTEVLARLPATLLLTGTALALTLILAIPIGALSAIRRYSLFDYIVTFTAFIGISMPGFWLALVLIDIFSNRLGLVPAVGMQSFGKDFTGLQSVLDVGKHLILPAIAMGFVEIAYWARYQRSALLEVMGQDYIRTARAKGLKERLVIWSHAFRNSLIPMITLAGLTLPDLVSGAYIIETIFGWPGMGRLGVKSILLRDYPVVMGVTMLSALLVVGGSLLADFLYALADPRIQQG
ncbi:MAG: ABC transporter permease [Anaerolineaceae bacterium]|nr:ABC transporter permease [Anaerolineaceae bacterium]